MAAPAPWTTRQKMIHASAIDPSGVARGPRRPRTSRSHQDHPLVALDVGDPAAEGEERGGRYEVAVDHPLHRGLAQVEVLLQLRYRDQADRLIDERHRDGADHPRQRDLLFVPELKLSPWFESSSNRLPPSYLTRLPWCSAKSCHRSSPAWLSSLRLWRRRSTAPETDPNADSGQFLVAALGDSITAGSPLWLKRGHPGRDQIKAVTRRVSRNTGPRGSHPELTFRNCGVFGERTDEIMDRLDDVPS